MQPSFPQRLPYYLRHSSRKATPAPADRTLQWLLTVQQRLYDLRATALQVMEILDQFEPFLHGSVLSGRIHPDSDVDLIAYTDAPDDVGECLQEAGYTVDFILVKSKRRGLLRAYPHYYVGLPDVVVEISVYPRDQLDRPPRSSVNGRPIRRGSITAVRRLVAESPQH